jgi:hypothetical protein
VPEDAADALREALRLDPRCEPAAVALAKLLVDTGPSHYPAAEALLRKTLSHISSVSLMTCLGRVCGLLGKFQDAIEQLNTAISIAADPTDAAGELENIEALLRDSGQGGGQQSGTLGDCGGGDAYSPAESRGDYPSAPASGDDDSDVVMHSAMLSGGGGRRGGGGGIDGTPHSGAHGAPRHPHAHAHGLDSLNGMDGMGLGMSMTSMASSAMSALSAADLDITHVEDVSGHGVDISMAMGSSRMGMGMSGTSVGTSAGRSGTRSARSVRHMGIPGIGALGGEDSMSDSVVTAGERGSEGVGGIAGDSPRGQPDFGSSPEYYT